MTDWGADAVKAIANRERRLRLEAERDALLDALTDMVGQHCADDAGLFSFALNANAGALVFAHWNPTREASMTVDPQAKPVPQPWSVALKKGRVVFTFTELEKIYGAFKFYINATAVPSGAGDSDYVVPQDSVHQDSNPKDVDASFEHSLIGNLQHFFFRCVTITPSEEHDLASGEASL